MTKLTIAPIGTCRVHTPLREGVGKNPIELSLGQNYGFVHTSTEALQQIRFMFEETKIPEDMSILIFRPNLSPNFSKKKHVAADVYVVEISSSKHLSIDGVPIQMNYAYRYFGDFFNNRERTRTFWSMASAEKFAERLDWLSRDPAYLSMNERDRSLLSRIAMRELSEDEIANDMQEIVKALGSDRVVFITHVNANTPDGTPIDARNRLINTVKRTAQSMNVNVYDPTALMHEMGQTIALENDGLDLTHYTSAFANLLYNDLHKRYFAPQLAIKLGNPANINNTEEHETVTGNMTLSDIEQAWAKGDVVTASRNVRHALRIDPSLHAHRLLLGRIQYQLADYEGALTNLDLVREELGPNDEIDLLLMRSNFEVENYDSALQNGKSLLSDEVETAEVIRTCAISAEKLGLAEESINYWGKLFQSGDHQMEAASAILHLLQKRGRASSVIAWCEQVLEDLPTHKEAYLALWDKRLEAGDRASLMALATMPQALTNEEIIALADKSSVLGFSTPAAVLAAPRVQTKNDANLSIWVSTQVGEWLRQGTALLEQGSLVRAGDLLQASWRLKPSGSSLIRARRVLEQALRKQVRQAFMSKNYNKVIELTTGALQTATEFPELDNFLGRAAAETGDLDTALTHLKKAANEDDAPLTAKIHLARVAAKSGNYLEAVEAYQGIISDSNVTDTAREDAERQLGGLTSRAVRSARELTTAGNYDAAWKLLNAVCKHEPSKAAAEREQTKVRSELRRAMQAADPADSATRLSIAKTMLRFDANDEFALKWSGIAAMRLHRFREALGYWENLRNINGATEAIENNIQKCQLWIERSNAKASVAA